MAPKEESTASRAAASPHILVHQGPEGQRVAGVEIHMVLRDLAGQDEHIQPLWRDDVAPFLHGRHALGGQAPPTGPQRKSKTRHTHLGRKQARGTLALEVALKSSQQLAALARLVAAKRGAAGEAGERGRDEVAGTGRVRSRAESELA